MTICSPLKTTLAAALFLAGAIGMPQAYASPDWAGEGAASVRLFSLGGKDEAKPSVGLEIRLDPGWKTYWVNPGPTGFQPRFDWSGSENLREAEVLWPAPRRIADGASQSLGYTGSVILPVRVVAQDAALPVRLKVGFDYGICQKICVPDHVDLRLDLEAEDRLDALTGARFSGFFKRVPKPSQLGAQDDFAVISANPGVEPRSLDVAVRAPEGARLVDLFPELPDGPSIGLPELIETAGDGIRLFRMKLRPASAPSQLRLVAIADSQALSVSVPLDAAPSRP